MTPPVLSLYDLLAAVSLDAWKQTILSIANTLGLVTENWAEGGYTRTVVALFTQLYATAGDLIRVIAASGFLDTATGQWLTLLARNVFLVDRIQATYASAPLAITLTNGGGGLFVYDPRDIVFAQVDTGKTYRNTSGGTLAPGVGQILVLDVEADEAGSASNAGVGTVTVMITTSLGVTCTNTVALVGLDEEKDPALRQRCRDSLAALALGGIKRAYEFFAKSAKRPDGSIIGVTRVLVMPPVGDGTLLVYIAGASGAIAPDDVTIVQGIFDSQVSPYGIDATAASATNIAITAPCTLWVPSALGLTDAEVKAGVLAAFQDYVTTLPIGGVIIAPATGKVYWRALLAVAAGSVVGSLKAQLTTEADITIAAGQVPVWSGVLADTTVVLVGS